jgi:hypothetical protein
MSPMTDNQPQYSNQEVVTKKPSTEPTENRDGGWQSIKERYEHQSSKPTQFPKEQPLNKSAWELLKENNVLMAIFFGAFVMLVALIGSENMRFMIRKFWWVIILVGVIVWILHKSVKKSETE